MLLQSKLKKPPAPIFERPLYNASREDFIDVLIRHSDNSTHLLVIAHCPAVIEVTEYYTGQYHDFKTASLGILSCQGDDLSASLKRPLQFHFERMIEALT
jgi:phosphohistidine phosphatase SixA